MESLVWYQSDYIEWEDGTRRLTGPGIIDRNEQGQAIRLRPFGSQSPAPSPEHSDELAQTEESIPDADTEPEAVSAEIVPGSRVVGG